MSTTKWFSKSFLELSNNELYDVLQLRTIVFVIEQNCIYLDMDDYDQNAIHLMGYKNQELVAYARIFAPGIKYQEASIGRVVTSQKVRGSGIGKLLMEKSVTFCSKNYPNYAIKISAQCYLEKFYQKLGFKITSGIYLEDGIEHQEMIYNI